MAANEVLPTWLVSTTVENSQESLECLFITVQSNKKTCAPLQGSSSWLKLEEGGITPVIMMPCLLISLIHWISERRRVKRLSRVRLFATPWTVACQAPPSMGFSRQEYWSGLSFPSPGDLSNPGIEPRSPTLQADALPSEPPGWPGLSTGWWAPKGQGRVWHKGAFNV